MEMTWSPGRCRYHLQVKHSYQRGKIVRDIIAANSESSLGHITDH